MSGPEEKTYEGWAQYLETLRPPGTRINSEVLERLHQEGVACLKAIEGKMKGKTVKEETVPEKAPKKTEPAKGTKKDSGKPRLSLFPPSYWEANCHPIAEAMSRWWFFDESLPLSLRFDALPAFTYGTKKYAPHNWVKGLEWSRFADSYLRHVSVFDEDRQAWVPRRVLTDCDAESGLPHGCHAEFYLITLREYILSNLGTDDRPEQG